MLPRFLRTLLPGRARFAAPLVYRVNPLSITYHGRPYPSSSLGRPHVYFPKKLNRQIKYATLPFVLSPRFQPETQLFSDSVAYKFLSDLWHAELNYRKTRRYKEYLEAISTGRLVRVKQRKIRTELQLDAYFLEYVELLTGMRDRGYDDSRQQNPIAIWIGPYGELIKDRRSGRHRLAAAKLSGCQTIPVEVQFVSGKWLQACLRVEPTEHEISTTISVIRAAIDTHLAVPQLIAPDMHSGSSSPIEESA